MERLASYVAIRRYDYALKSGDVAEKGKIAFAESGTGKVTTTVTAVALGLFQTTLTGDGTTKVTILFWNEIFAYWFANDAAGLILATDLFSTAHAKDGSTVSKTGGAGTFPLGLVLDVDSAQGVLVYISYPVPALV